MQDWVDVENAEFIYGLSEPEMRLLQEFMYKSVGIIPYQAFAQYYPQKTTSIQLPLPGFEDYKITLEREYPHYEAVDIEQKIINCLKKVRIKIDEHNEDFMEALRYLHSREVEEYGENYWAYHTKESDLPPSSLELIKENFGQNKRNI